MDKDASPGVVARFPPELARRMAGALRVPELRAQLQLQGVSVEGKKPQLVDRLIGCWDTAGVVPSASPRKRVREDVLASWVGEQKRNRLDGRMLAAVMPYVCGTIGLPRYESICAPWRDYARASIRSTGVAADCLAVPDHATALLFFRYLARAEAKLSSLRIHVGADETAVLQWLLSSCDTTGLRRLDIKVMEAPRWLYHTQVEGGMVDLSLYDGNANQVVDSMIAQDAGRYGDTLDHIPVEGVLGATCGSVQSLRLSAPFEVLPALPALTELHLGISYRCCSSVSAIEAAVSCQPRLQSLSISGCLQQHVSFTFSSRSLQRVNLCGPGSKGLWIGSLACPSLTKISCVPSRWGNGIRPTVGGAIHQEPGEFVLGENCDGFTSERFDGGMPMPITLPPGCRLVMEDY